MCTNFFAQGATSSILSNMKAINPALIGQRSNGHMSLVTSKDKIIKDFDLEEGAGEKGDTLINIDSSNFFS